MSELRPRITGKVVRGRGIGNTLGFPTANLVIKNRPGGMAKIRPGIYGGAAILPSGKSYRSGIVVSAQKPGKRILLEAYLIGFKGDLYGKRLCLRLDGYLRPMRKYKTRSGLIRRIQKDILIIKSWTSAKR